MAYIASKMLGLIRQVLFNALFGTGAQATAYYAAFRLPDTLFNLIAGGALISAFLPIFVSYETQRGEREAWRLASLVFNVMLVSLTACVLLAELVAPAFVTKLLVPGLPPFEQALTITLTRIMLLHPLILGLGSVATAMLNSKRQFLRPALSIAIYDVGLIGGLLVSFAVPGVGIYGPTVGLLVSALLQVGVLVPPLVKQGVRYSFLWNLKHPGLYEVLGLLVPSLIVVGLGAVGAIFDTAIASYLPDKGSIAAIANASMLFGLPSVLLAQALGHSLLPQISLQATQSRYLRLSLTIGKVVGGAVLLCIPPRSCFRLSCLLNPGFNPPHQPRYQRNPCWQIIQLNILAGVVGQAATGAQAIERGYAHGGSGVGVGCAAAASILNLQAEFAAGCFCQFDEVGVAFVAFEWLAKHAATECNACSLQLVLIGYLAHGGFECSRGWPGRLRAHPCQSRHNRARRWCGHRHG